MAETFPSRWRNFEQVAGGESFVDIDGEKDANGKTLLATLMAD